MTRNGDHDGSARPVSFAPPEKRIPAHPLVEQDLHRGRAVLAGAAQVQLVAAADSTTSGAMPEWSGVLIRYRSSPRSAARVSPARTVRVLMIGRYPATRAATSHRGVVVAVPAARFARRGLGRARAMAA
ncbi:hypothetical protein GCM10028775_43860 [Catellatospora paridis]